MAQRRGESLDLYYGFVTICKEKINMLGCQNNSNYGGYDVG